jgi:uncharacterized membrane protein YgdD (TMEM256/DUF423 family)
MMSAGSAQKIIRKAALLGFLAVLLGAFGAHGLKTRITADMLAVFEIGCRYQLAHALALLALMGLGPYVHEKILQRVGHCWVLGIFIFSGSLYVLALTGARRWGMVTPMGGLLLMGGWLYLFLGAFQRTSSQKSNKLG